MPVIRRAALVLASFSAVASGQISFGPSKEISDFIYQPDYVLAHDMDGDGDLDVIAAEGNGAPVRVLWWENDSTGSFGNRREWTWGILGSEAIAIADFNLDGLPDVWIQDIPWGSEEPDGTVQRRFLIALADGAGSFQPPTLLIDERATRGTGGTFVCDTNLDGRPDIVTSDTHYLATPSGTFAAGIPMPVEASYLWYDRKEVVPVDLDEDGDLDLLITSVASNPAYAVQVMWNSGSGTFAAPTPYSPLDQAATNRQIASCTNPSGEGGPALLVLTAQDSVGASQRNLALYKLTASGAAELVTSFDLEASDDAIWRSWDGLSHDTSSERSFIGVVLAPTAGIDPTSELFEIVWSDDNLSLASIAVHQGVIAYPPVAVRSLNGDPFPDLLVPIPDITFTTNAAADQIVWHAGKSGGGFGSAPYHVCQPGVDRTLYHAGDLDGDGATDLLLGGYPPLTMPMGSHELSLYRNNGDGSAFERLPIDVGRKRVSVIAVKDITWPRAGGGSWPSGRMDVLVETYDYAGARAPGTLRFEWLLQDDGGMFHRTTLTSESSNGLVSPYYGDWDGDGMEDLVYAAEIGYVRPVLVWRRGTGSGFDAPRSLLTLVEWPLGLVDIDWDGDLDLIQFGYLFGGEECYWCENDGSGTITSLRVLPGKVGPLGVDLDGDGHEDFSDASSILFAREGVTFERPDVPLWFPTPTALDLDGDGDLDLVHSTPTQYTHGYNALGWWENRGNGVFFAPQDSPPMLPIAGARWSARDSQALADIDGDGMRDLVVVSILAPRVEWFRVTSTPAPTAFTDWMAGYGFRGHSAGPLADVDGDRRVNWEEFAFGSNPGLNDPAHAGLPWIRRDGATLALSFLRRTDASAVGLGYPVMQSTDLLQWAPWSGAFGVSQEAEGYERVSFLLDPSEPRRFFSVQPTGPPAGP